MEVKPFGLILEEEFVHKFLIFKARNSKLNFRLTTKTVLRI